MAQVECVWTTPPICSKAVMIASRYRIETLVDEREQVFEPAKVLVAREPGGVAGPVQ